MKNIKTKAAKAYSRKLWPQTIYDRIDAVLATDENDLDFSGVSHPPSVLSERGRENCFFAMERFFGAIRGGGDPVVFERPDLWPTDKIIDQFEARLAADGVRDNSAISYLDRIKMVFERLNLNTRWIEYRIYEWRQRTQKKIRTTAATPDRTLKAGIDLMERSLSEIHLWDQFASARAKVGNPHIRYRDGLMIAFLSLEPLRSFNLLGLTIGTTFERSNGLKKAHSIHFDASKTKEGNQIIRDLPAEIAAYIDIWLDDIRPCFHPDDDNAAFWLNRHGEPLGYQGAYRAIKLRSENLIGSSLSPHLFRHMAASALVKAGVSDDQTAIVLQQTSSATAKIHYTKEISSAAPGQIAKIVGV